MAHADTESPRGVLGGRHAVASLATCQETVRGGGARELAGPSLADLEGSGRREFAQIVARLDADREMAELMAGAALRHDTPASRHLRHGVEDLVDDAHARRSGATASRLCGSPSARCSWASAC